MRTAHFLAPVFAASAALGQSSVRPVPPAAAAVVDTIPIHTAPQDGGLAYGIWATGRDYKVSFHDGMEFVPYLGAGYPRNQSLTWATESITIGGVELGVGEPAGSGEGLQYRYDLGGFREIYDVRPEGLYQSFEIPRRPAGAAGELVVRGRVATDLRAADRGAEHAALCFADADGRVLLSYGAAVAVDADGRRAPMTTSFQDGVVTLVAGADWVAEARFPVVVDPLLASVGVYVLAAPLAAIDTFREEDGTSSGGRIYVANERATSAVDSDMFVVRFDDGFANPTTVFQDVTAQWSTSVASLAGNGNLDKLVMGFSRWFPNSDLSQLRWSVRDYADPAPSNAVGFPPAAVVGSKVDDWRVDVGGTAGGSRGRDALLVWQREFSPPGSPFQNTPRSQAYAAVLDLSGGGVGVLGTPFPLTTSPSFDAEWPSVNTGSAGGAATYDWVVVCSEFDGSGWWQLRACAVRSDGTATSGIQIDAGSPLHKLEPIVEGRAGRYIVGFSGSGAAGKPQLGFGTWLSAVRVDGGTAGLTSLTPQRFATWASPRLRVQRIGYDTDTASHWLLATQNAQSSEASVTLVGYTGRALRTELVSSGGSLPLLGVSFDADAHDYVCVIGRPMFVRATRFFYPAIVPWSVGGTGCSPATIRWFSRTGNAGVSNQLIGNEFSGVRVDGAPAGAIHFLLLSTVRVDLAVPHPLVGRGCRLLVDNNAPGFVGVLDFTVGASARWNLPIPEALVSGSFHFQDWILDPAAGTFTSTARLQVPVVR